jgi:hypothetical protein
MPFGSHELGPHRLNALAIEKGGTMTLNRWKVKVWKFNGWSIEEFHRQIRHNLPSDSCKSIGGIA